MRSAAANRTVRRKRNGAVYAAAASLAHVAVQRRAALAKSGLLRCLPRARLSIEALVICQGLCTVASAARDYTAERVCALAIHEH